jgi:hypothetical protein
MANMLAQISRQTVANAVAIAPPTQEQIDREKREVAGVERQLRRNGKTEQAERLRTQLGNMMPGVTAPANPIALPPTSPNP